MSEEVRKTLILGAREAHRRLNVEIESGYRDYDAMRVQLERYIAYLKAADEIAGYPPGPVRRSCVNLKDPLG